METIPQIPTWAVVGVLVVGVAAILPLIGGLVFLGSWSGRLETRVSSAEKTAEVARERAHDIANQFQSYKLEARDQFVQQGAMDKLEARVMAGITSLADRIDKVLSPAQHG